MSKRKRASNSEKQLAALANTQAPKPDDAPQGEKSKTISVEMYSNSLADLLELKELAGNPSRSIVVRKALAYAIANKEDFLKKSFGG